MESVKRMRQICQAPRAWCDTWHGRLISRRISIYITRFFLRIGFTPNMATCVFFSSIAVPCIFLGIGSRLGILVGIIFLQFWYVLDHVDGEIARYKNLSTRTGIYFDGIVHYVSHPLVFASLGYGLMRRYNAPYIYLAAFSTAISTVLIDILLDVKKAVLFDEGVRKEDAGEFKKEETAKHLIKKIFSLVHKSCTFPFAMDTLFAASVLDVFLHAHFVLCTAIYLSFAMPLVWACKLVKTVLRRELDYAKK